MCTPAIGLGHLVLSLRDWLLTEATTGLFFIHVRLPPRRPVAVERETRRGRGHRPVVGRQRERSPATSIAMRRGPPCRQSQPSSASSPCGADLRPTTDPARGLTLGRHGLPPEQWQCHRAAMTVHRPGRVPPRTRQPIGYRPIDPRTLVALTHALRLPTGPLSAARAVSIVEMCEGWSTSSSGRSSPPWWRILLGDPRRISSDGQAIAL